MNRYPMFDWLRLILSMSIMIGHMGFLPSGNLAVSGFLVLSGFLICSSLERSRGYVDFAKRRFLRIVPAFALSLLLVGSLFGARAAWNAFTYWGLLGYSGNCENRALWSLGHEEVFYVLMASLFSLGLLTRRSTIAVGLLVGLALALLGFHFGAEDYNRIHRALPLVWSLFVGVAGYCTAERLPRFRWLGIFLILTGVIVYEYTKVVPAGALLFAPGVLLVGTGFRPWKPGWLPDFSYGLYVYHMPLLMFWREMNWSLYLYCVTALSLSVLSAIFIEQPIMTLKSGKSRTGKSGDDFVKSSHELLEV